VLAFEFEKARLEADGWFSSLLDQLPSRAQIRTAGRLPQGRAAPSGGRSDAGWSGPPTVGVRFHSGRVSASCGSRTSGATAPPRDSGLVFFFFLAPKAAGQGFLPASSPRTIHHLVAFVEGMVLAPEDFGRAAPARPSRGSRCRQAAARRTSGSGAYFTARSPTRRAACAEHVVLRPGTVLLSKRRNALQQFRTK